MNWNINTATIVGRDHEFSRKNRQDFLHTYQSDELIVGVVCDGCGESKYSEVGAALIGTFIVNYLKSFNGIINFNHIKGFKEILEYDLTCFLNNIENLVFFNDNCEKEKISFIKEFLLSTCLFCILTKDSVIIANCGDGIIIINDEIKIIDQYSIPEYIAYKIVPKEALEKTPSELSFFNIQVFDCKDINKIVIGSDGIQPLIDENLILHIYGKQKRQLQRKFNVWQNEGVFGDDASCIVIEKQNGDKDSSL
ncbi:MAG: protein phosphatase 2C domain-containing protein [Candidatus Nanoarchaeia archaeon]|jgi:serine/threonine protein phosphatase PrpC|nr:protein phosphatase 2C domain-containing protein [Candidatus Nanoarchaeia archaeon]